MGKLKDLVIECQEFAQDNYNEPREEFVMMTNTYFKTSIEREAAIQAFDEIQDEMKFAYAYREAF
jgi:hypothetical protein